MTPLEAGAVVAIAAVGGISYLRSERTGPDAIHALGILVAAGGLALHAITATRWSAAIAFVGGALAVAVSFAQLESAAKYGDL